MLTKEDPCVEVPKGFLQYPANFHQVEGISTVKNDRLVNIRPVSSQQLDSALCSSEHPIQDNPRFELLDTGMQIYPQVTTELTLTYFIKPETPVISCTYDGNKQIYDPAASKQLIFAPAYYFEVITRALPFLGMSLPGQSAALIEEPFREPALS